MQAMATGTKQACRIFMAELANFQNFALLNLARYALATYSKILKCCVSLYFHSPRSCHNLSNTLQSRQLLMASLNCISRITNLNCHAVTKSEQVPISALQLQKPPLPR